MKQFITGWNNGHKITINIKNILSVQTEYIGDLVHVIYKFDCEADIFKYSSKARGFIYHCTVERMFDEFEVDSSEHKTFTELFE